MSLLVGASVAVFGIIALVLVVTALLLWHNFCCGRWCIEVLSRAPAWLQQCWRERQAARASSARAAPAECSTAPPPSAWQLHYNTAYAVPKDTHCCAGDDGDGDGEEGRFDDEPSDAVAQPRLHDTASVPGVGRAHSDVERGELGDALGPLPAARGSASRAARHSSGRGGRNAAVQLATAAPPPQAALWHDAAAAR